VAERVTAPFEPAPLASVPLEPVPARDGSRGLIRWTRILLTLALIPLAWHAFHDEYGAVPMLSGVDLAIHEFGHVLFEPFGIPFLGRTMVILGGSLTQVVFPLIFMLYFLRNREGARDLHAATVCLWWSSMNLVSVAAYCADALPMKLMLISGGTGQEVEGHDWNQLLVGWRILRSATSIARAMTAVAWLMCVVSIGAGLIAAWNSGRPREAATNLNG
jgi:hypothetical protein